jgi:hypothetical protein
MSFASLTTATARWRSVSGSGLEHLDLRRDGEEVTAEGVIVGDRGALPYGVHYRILCDARWRTLLLQIHTTAGLTLRLRADGNGHWSDVNGNEMTRLDGCIDVDLAGSPFTNTLPIRRLELTPEDRPRELKMVYIPFTTFMPTVDEQRYRCIATDTLYRYEAVDRSFTADLPVDRNGLVIDYPSLFVRVDL